jgi:hypothetical protein
MAYRCWVAWWRPVSGCALSCLKICTSTVKIIYHWGCFSCKLLYISIGLWLRRLADGNCGRCGYILMRVWFVTLCVTLWGCIWRMTASKIGFGFVVILSFSWLLAIVNILRNNTDYRPYNPQVSDTVLQCFAYVFLCRPDDGRNILPCIVFC